MVEIQDIKEVEEDTAQEEDKIMVAKVKTWEDTWVAKTKEGIWVDKVECQVLKVWVDKE